MKISDIMVLMESWGELHSNKLLSMVGSSIRDWLKGSDISKVVSFELKDDVVGLMQGYEQHSPLELVSGYTRSYIK